MVHDNEEISFSIYAAVEFLKNRNVRALKLLMFAIVPLFLAKSLGVIAAIIIDVLANAQ